MSTTNTITNLIPDIYEAMDVVSRELVGFIPSVSRDSQAARAAVGQNVRSFVAPASTASDITPAVTPPDDGSQTIGNLLFTITKARRVPVRWAGEESRGLNNGGPGRNSIMMQQFAQAFRTLCNEIEVDLAALHIGASRAYGTAGTTPFASDLSELANIRKILDDNGAPGGDRHGVMNTTAGAKMRSLSQLTKANEAGGDSFLRQGTMLNIFDLNLKESAQVKTSVAGTAASATTDNAGYAIGATVLTLAAAGTGTLVAGDVVTFVGDTNKYVIVSGDTDVSNGGTFTIALPGLLVAMSAATKAITVVAAAARNMFFSRNAIHLATRAPALPEEGDSASDRVVLTDAWSGLAIEVSMYKQYRQVQYELAIAWGKAVMKAEHLALLLG